MMGLMRKSEHEAYIKCYKKKIEKLNREIRDLEISRETQSDLWLEQAVKYNKALQMDFNNMKVQMRKTFCDGAVVKTLKERLKNYDVLIEERRQLGGSQSIDELLWRRDELRMVIGMLEMQNPELFESLSNPLCKDVSWKLVREMEKIE